MKPAKVQGQIAAYIEALQKIAALAKDFDGDTEEEEWNDMEDAFNNGTDVGRYEALTEAAAIAKTVLR